MVGPVWETRGAMFKRTRPERRNPAGGHGGVPEAFAVSSCKVDGNGKRPAECKINLLEHPDAAQR